MVAVGVVLARGVVRWVGWRGLLRLGLLEVKGRRVDLDDAGVVGRIKAAAAEVVVVEVRGLLRIRARVPRMATVPSMVVRKRRRLELGKGRRRKLEQQRPGEEEK